MVPLPFVAPPVWPEVKLGRFAHAILRNGPELLEHHAAPAEVGKCQIALFGLADDLGVELNGGRVGAAQGPNAFRAALAKFGVAEPMGWEWPRVFDVGNIIPASGSDEAALHETHRRITETVKSVLEMSNGQLFPIAVGGGHDLTFPFVRAVIENARTRGIQLDAGVYFDAHLDVRPTAGSGMPFRKLVEDCAVRNLAVYGASPFANNREHWQWFLNHGGTPHNIGAFSSLDHAGGWLTSPNHEQSGGTFVSLDLDVLDSSIAPGVSALNACGITMPPLCEAIEVAGACPSVRCFDIMELNPVHDEQSRTARAAAHLFLSFLKGYTHRTTSHPRPPIAGPR